MQILRWGNKTATFCRTEPLAHHAIIVFAALRDVELCGHFMLRWGQANPKQQTHDVSTRLKNHKLEGLGELGCSFEELGLPSDSESSNSRSKASRGPCPSQVYPHSFVVLEWSHSLGSDFLEDEQRYEQRFERKLQTQPQPVFSVTGWRFSCASFRQTDIWRLCCMCSNMLKPKSVVFARWMMFSKEQMK